MNFFYVDNECMYELCVKHLVEARSYKDWTGEYSMLCVTDKFNKFL